MSTEKARPVWKNRFRTPQAPELLDAMDKQVSVVVAYARDLIRGFPQLSETLEWQGVWNWTFTYSNGDPRGPVAFVVPNPARPRLTLALPDEAIPNLPIKKLSRYVRDGLAHAPVVDGVRWAAWDIASKGQVDEVVTLLRLRYPADPGPKSS